MQKIHVVKTLPRYFKRYRCTGKVLKICKTVHFAKIIPKQNMQHKTVLLKKILIKYLEICFITTILFLLGELKHSGMFLALFLPVVQIWLIFNRVKFSTFQFFDFCEKAELFEFATLVCLCIEVDAFHLHYFVFIFIWTNHAETYRQTFEENKR